MNEIWHRCKANDSGFAMKFINGQWALYDVFANTHWSFGFHRCPYCGVKLESPDVKIAASRSMLENCVDQLWTVHEDIEGHKTDAPERVFSIARQLNKVLREASGVEEHNPPDIEVKVVSQRALEDKALLDDFARIIRALSRRVLEERKNDD